MIEEEKMRTHGCAIISLMNQEAPILFTPTHPPRSITSPTSPIHSHDVDQTASGSMSFDSKGHSLTAPRDIRKYILSPSSDGNRERLFPRRRPPSSPPAPVFNNSTSHFTKYGDHTTSGLCSARGEAWRASRYGEIGYGGNMW